MLSRYAGAALVLSNILIPIAIFVFAAGFFPHKAVLPGLAKHAELGGLSLPQAQFDKVIFMVIDALRSDFVFSEASAFKYTQSLISSGNAVPFTAFARSPTVTMPRIKALTTGSIPSFLDVILNLDEADKSSSLSSQDSWLAQINSTLEKNLIMFGDDTWLKLFPEMFYRADGTTSFFVADYTEVDKNVTRHVPEELKNTDWDAMILHYLGLDHIGHKSGPQSQNMPSKQREMDGIIQQIFESMKSEPHLKDTLLVLVGDHGMNDAGNHGGSSAGETSAALIFFSKKLEKIGLSLAAPAKESEPYQFYTVIEQSDIVPSLAALLGFPIPRNNLGVIIPDILRLWEERDAAQLLLRNAYQLNAIIEATFGLFSTSTEGCEDPTSDYHDLACRWAALQAKVSVWISDQETADLFEELLGYSRSAQSFMSGVASNYDLPKMFAGAALAAVALIIVSSVLLAEPVGWSYSATSLWVASLLYGLMMLGSSYVEEEHHFWYWANSAWMSLLIVTRRRFRASLRFWLFLGSMLILKVVRRWNQTGQKHAGSPDISKTFLANNIVLLWAAVIFAVLNLSSEFLASATDPMMLPFAMLQCSVLGLVVVFKILFTHADSPELLGTFARRFEEFSYAISLVELAQACFIGMFIITIARVGYYLYMPKGRTASKSLRVDLHNMLTLFLLMQTKVTNIPLYLLFQLLFRILIRLQLRFEEVSVTSIAMQYLSFFAFGGSNAISSVDLSNAYNGVSGFNVVAVGFLTFVSNWAGPIWWTSACYLLLFRGPPNMKTELLIQNITFVTVFTSFSLLAVIGACTILRTHLFIWTVFSPKYLFCMAWSLGQHLVVNIVLGYFYSCI